MVRVLWPHSQLGDDPRAVLKLWHAMLGGFEHEDVEAAVKEWAAIGERHAPLPGVLVAMVSRRAVELPEWDEVRDEVIRVSKTYRRPPDEGGIYWGDPLGAGDPGRVAPPAEEWSHALVGQFMEGRWEEWRHHRLGDTTFYAQQRDAYNALRERVHRDVGLLAVGASRRRSELGRVNMAALLPGTGD